MNRTLTTLVLALIAGFASGPSHAVLILGPGDAVASSSSAANPASLAAINSFFNTSYTGLSLQYKDNVGGAEEGPLAGSYETVFSNSAAEPADADITYVGGVAVGPCPTCILVVKGGGPPFLTALQYLFDLGSWNGVEEIELRGFFPAQGAVSNVAIWAGEGNVQVPEPGTLGLLGAGLLGLGLLRRRRS